MKSVQNVLSKSKVYQRHYGADRALRLANRFMVKGDLDKANRAWDIAHALRNKMKK